MDIEYLKANWSIKSVKEISAALGVPEQKIRNHAITLNLGPPAPPPEPASPTRNEIRRRAAQIRATWSPEEKERRFVGRRRGEGWTVPVIKMETIEAPSFSRI
jgi:hypothetical protein